MKIKTLVLSSFMLLLALGSCKKTDIINDGDSISDVNAAVAERHGCVLHGYPTYLLSTPIITSNLPQEVIEAQTPIDIQTCNTTKFRSSTPALHYGNITLSSVINNDGENLKVSLSAADQVNNYVIIAGKKYTLSQFHFHYSSEHTINGQHKPMEIHFVNIASDNSYAVLGVMVDFGGYNNNLQTLFDASPHVPGDVNSLSTQLNLAQLFPLNKSRYYTYSGSLTTPNYGVNSSIPNGGPVTWIVYNDTKKLTHAQLDSYEDIYEEHNFRDVQPLNGRTVYEHVNH